MKKSESIQLLSRNLEPESFLGLFQGSRTHTDVKQGLPTLGPWAPTRCHCLTGSWWKREVHEGP